MPLFVPGLCYVFMSQITTLFSFALKIFSEFEATAMFLLVDYEVMNSPPEL